MDKELYAVAGTGIGVLATLLTNWVSTRNQTRLAEIAAERDVRRDEVKAQGDWQLKAAEQAHAASLKLLDRSLDRLEPAYVHLSAIARQFSLTGVTMHENAGVDAQQFDQFYQEQCTLLDSVSAAVSFYSPEVSLSTDELAGAMNVYWGRVQHLLYLRKQRPENRQWIQDSLVEIVEASRNVSREARTLLSAIQGSARSQRVRMLPGS